jgi:hypothetical protein
MFGMYRVVKVTPGTNPGIDGCYMVPQSGWMTREKARNLMFTWAPLTDSRDLLQMERRFTGTLTDDVFRGQRQVTRWSL